MSKQASQKQKRYKLPHSVIVHAPGLLPMMYRTRELAEELGVATQTVVTWAKNGVPHDRDRKGHIWIHGRAFATWVQSQRGKRSRMRMADDQAYCFRCKKPVCMLNAERRRIERLTLLSGKCSICGTTVNRGSSDD